MASLHDDEILTTAGAEAKSRWTQDDDSDDQDADADDADADTDDADA